MPTITPPTTLALRPYQQAGLDASRQALERGVTRQALVWPTGGGKTVLFAHIIRGRGGRALVLAHRDELIEQAVDKLRQVAPDLRPGVVKAERNDIDADVLVASVQTVWRPNRLEQLPAAYATVVVDEAHHAVADTYRAVLEHVTGQGELLLGVTATPDRLDKLGLEHIFQEIVHQVGLLELIQSGYLVDIRAIRVELDVDFDSITRRGGDLVEGELAEALSSANAPEHVADAYVEHASDRTGVVFTPNVALAFETAEALNDVGITTAALHGGTPIDERRAILRRLADGEVQVVANCMVLTEGFDQPRVDCIVNARPTQSRALYQQMIGRGMRLYPGKTDLLVIDLVGNSRRHELVTVASLLGLDPDEVAKGGVLEAEAAKERLARERTEAVPGVLVARNVDLFDRRGMVWADTGRGHVLSLDDAGFVGIEQAPDGTWRVLVHDGKSWGTRLRQTHQNLSQEYAMGVAEELAREHVPRILRDPQARWRDEPPSEGQLAFYSRRGWSPPASKGHASVRMTKYFAEQAWWRARR